MDASKLQNYVYLQTYRVDVLIAESAPSAKPLLVLEFDGPTHTGTEQRKKDSIRDAILIDAQLPVFRISSCTDCRSLFFNQYVQFLVARLVEVIQFREKGRPSDEELIPDFQKRLARYRKKASRIDIAPDINTKIFQEALMSLDERRFLESANAAIEELEAEQIWMHDCDPGALASSLGKIVKTTNAFTTIGQVGGESGFHVKASITVDGKEHSIRSPNIFIVVKSESEKRKIYEDIVVQAAMACAIETFVSQYTERD